MKFAKDKKISPSTLNRLLECPTQHTKKRSFLRINLRILWNNLMNISPWKSTFWFKYIFDFPEARAEIVGAPIRYLTPGSTLKLICQIVQNTEASAFIFWYHDSRMINFDVDRGINVSTEAGMPITSKSFVYLKTGRMPKPLTDNALISYYPPYFHLLFPLRLPFVRADHNWCPEGAFRQLQLCTEQRSTRLRSGARLQRYDNE